MFVFLFAVACLFLILIMLLYFSCLDGVCPFLNKRITYLLVSSLVLLRINSTYIVCRARDREFLDSLDVYLWEHSVFRW